MSVNSIIGRSAGFAPGLFFVRFAGAEKQERW